MVKVTRRDLVGTPENAYRPDVLITNRDMLRYLDYIADGLAVGLYNKAQVYNIAAEACLHPGSRSKSDIVRYSCY